ncbi:MAG: hypothetical protein CL685_02770 [Candidatus Magasanikbacteria bacterium]|nr:hypothetical protein [Candidatus Magasanikbacteria bacterium]
MIYYYHMILEKYLQQLGLSEKESKVYIATLQLGSGSVQEIAQKAGIKRPTTYTIIDELVKKGLVSKKISTKNTIFSAEGPENLGNLLEQKKYALSSALPLLKNIYKEESNKPSVKIYEGLDGTKQVYFNTIWMSKTEVLFFSSVKKLISLYPNILDSWVDHLQKEKISTKELINPEREDIIYGINSYINNNNNLQEIRIIPKGMKRKFTDSDHAIFDDKLMFVTLEGKIFTTVIKNKTLADSMRTLFYLACEKATPVVDFVIKNKEEYPELYRKIEAKQKKDREEKQNS